MERYVKDDYTIDKFLAKFEQRPDLENLRKELKVYANELHTAMTDILKTETEAIVNLAEHLTNLNSKVSQLSSPVFQLHEEIKALNTVIRDAEKELETHLEDTKIANRTRDTTDMQANMKLTSIYVNNIINKRLGGDISDIAVLERAVDEFSFQSIYLKELYPGEIKKDDTSAEIEKILKTLVDQIFIKSLQNNMQKSIVCCLRTYVSLNQQTQAELIYSSKIVEPVLRRIFTNSNLERHNHRLIFLYQEALQFLNKDVKYLVDLINSNSGLKGFNFIVNSYWRIADKLLQENLPHVTAPGNPELFQKRFHDTWQFLFAIANRVSPSLIYESSFQDHMKRFNLAVYFEIRFQQISASFETDIVEKIHEPASKHAFLKLKVSAAFWRSINHCFHSEVFLAHLSDQFIKLSLLLLSRFLVFIDTIIRNEEEPPSEEFVVNLMLDINSLKESLGRKRIDDIPNSIYKILPKNLWEYIKQIIQINEKMLSESQEKLKNYLIGYKVEQSVSLLQQISAIPRLYRRTNKFAPTDESSYVRDVVCPIEKFYNDNQKLLGDSLRDIMDTCINRIGEQYITLVEDVLCSVCKTEESLRRLKSRNVSSTDESHNPKGDLSSDEAKIREQIKLDVKYFVTHMSPFVSKGGKAILDALSEESDCSS